MRHQMFTEKRVDKRFLKKKEDKTCTYLMKCLMEGLCYIKVSAEELQLCISIRLVRIRNNENDLPSGSSSNGKKLVKIAKNYSQGIQPLNVMVV